MGDNRQKRMIYFLQRCVLLVVVGNGFALGESYEKQIVAAIFADYDYRLRPILNDVTVTNVTVDVAVLHVIQMENKKQVLNALLDQAMYWKDEHLQWNPGDYGGISKVVLPASQVWTPDIQVYNSVDDAVSNPSTNIRAVIRSNGRVTLSWRPLFAEIACRVSVRSFPFDTQICELVYGSWTYDIAKVNLLPSQEKLNMSSFQSVGEWLLTDSVIDTNIIVGRDGEMYKTVTVAFALDRKSALYGTCYVFPCFLISSMMLLSFLIPYQYGVQKISMGVTLFLTGMVYLQSLIKVLPATTRSPILLGQYYISMLSVLSGGILANIISLTLANMGSNGKRQVPNWLRKLVFLECKTPKCIKDEVVAMTTLANSASSQNIPTQNRQNVQPDKHTSTETSLRNIEGVVHDIRNTMRRYTSSTSAKSTTDHEWKKVAKAFDRVCFVTFIILITVVFSLIQTWADDWTMIYTDMENEAWALVQSKPPMPGPLK